MSKSLATTAGIPGKTLSDLRRNPLWSELPLFDRMGWKRVRFGDVVESCNATCDPREAGLERFIAMEHLEPGSLHVRSWGNVADGTTFTRRCGPGQVLFGKRRAYQRKVAVAEFDAVVSGDIYVLAPKDDRLLPVLLPFLCLCERFFQHAVGTSAGSLSPRTNWGDGVRTNFQSNIALTRTFRAYYPAISSPASGNRLPAPCATSITSSASSPDSTPGGPAIRAPGIAKRSPPPSAPRLPMSPPCAIVRSGRALLPCHGLPTAQGSTIGHRHGIPCSSRPGSKGKGVMRHFLTESGCALSFCRKMSHDPSFCPRGGCSEKAPRMRGLTPAGSSCWSG